MAGLVGGLAGIGGSIIMLPAPASVMWVTALIGASLKLYTLESHLLDWLDALSLASLMAIGAVLGARTGATLTHRLPLKQLKLAIAIVLGIAAGRMGYLSVQDFRVDQADESADSAEPAQSVETQSVESVVVPNG